MTTPAPTGTDLAPPTVIDLIDAVVRASNNLVVWELANINAGTPTMSDFTWERFVEADYFANSVQDALYERHRGTNVYGEPAEP